MKILVVKKGIGSMDFSKILEKKEGIYSITIHSEFNGFVQWYTVYIERSPSAEYTAPQDYVLISSSESVSPGGVVTAETFVPEFSLDVQKLILIYPDSESKPIAGPTKGVPSLYMDDMEDIAVNAFDIKSVLGKLLTTVEATGIASCSASVTSELIQLGDMFAVPPYVISSMLYTLQCTVQSIMMSLYAGMGLIIKQTTEGFILTDLMTAMKEKAVKVDAGNIVSLATSFNYKNIPKTQTINFGADGSITDSDAISTSIDNLTLEISQANQGKYGDNLAYRNTSGSSLSQAVGTAINITAKAPPILGVAQLNNIIADKDGNVTLTIGKKTKKVKLQKIEKVKDTMKKRKNIKFKKSSWNYAAAQVVAKRMFMEKIQSLMSFRVITASSSKSAIIDGVVGNHFGNVDFSGGKISLQKAIIKNSEIVYEQEEGSLSDNGFVTGLSITMQSGITTSTIAYINIKDAYKGIF